MVECLTLDKGVVRLSLSGGTILFPCARHVIHYVVLVQPRKRPYMTENFLTGLGGSRGGDDRSPDAPPPLKDHKIDFHSNTGPLKNRKATRPEFNVRPSSGCY